MESMDGWSMALLALAAYVAVTSLVRLMIRRRNELMDRFRQELEKEKGRLPAQGSRPPRRDKAA